MVNVRPFSVRGWTSMKPTVVIVMTVMYKDSDSVQPSTRWYPSVPRPTSRVGMTSRSKRRGSAT